MTDPTFYRTPLEAATAPIEQLAYVAAFDPTGQKNDAIAVLDCDAGSATYGEVVGWSRAADRWQRAAPLRLERLLQRAVPRRARRPPRTQIPHRSGHTVVAHLHPGHEDPTRGRRRWYARSKPASWPTRPATPDRTRCTADPTASSCRRWAAPTETTGPEVWRCSTTRRSMSSGRGNSTAATSSSLTTSGGI